MTGWAKAKQAAKYAGVSERTFRDWLRSGKLKHTKLPTGTVLIRFAAVDDFLQQFEAGQDDGVRSIVDDVVNRMSI